MENDESGPDSGDVVISPEPVRLTLTTFAPSITVKGALWNNWSRIAIEHEAEAWRHRTDWKESRLRNIMPEFHASMVCVSAVAFTFQALHSSVSPLLNPGFRPTDRITWSEMRETITIACTPTGNWQKDFEWLFRVARRSAVHFVPEEHTPLWHEALQTNIAQENHIFSAESTTRTVDLMMNVFHALFDPASKRAPSVEEWSRQRAHVLDELTSLRTGR